MCCGVWPPLTQIDFDVIDRKIDEKMLLHCVFLASFVVATKACEPLSQNQLTNQVRYDDSCVWLVS